MKKLKLPKSFTVKAMFLYVALFCVSSYALLEHVSISIGAFSMLKLPMMYVGFVCLIPQIDTIYKCVFRKNQVFTLLTLGLFCILLIISMFGNRDAMFGESPLYDTVRFLLFLVELFLVMIVLAETGRARQAVGFLFWYVAALTVVNDLLMFTGVIRFKVGRFETYIVGSKFAVSYLHMNLLTLWNVRSMWRPLKRRMPKWLIVLLAAYIVCVALRVDCMTGIIGCLALVLLFGLVRSPKRGRLLQFTSPTVLVLVLVASVAFVVLVDAILDLPFVQFVVEDVFQRNLTLTGRTNIYNAYFRRMEGHMLLGYGLGNANIASVTMFGYENVQNALLQWVLQIGVPATVALVLVMVQIFRQVHRKRLHNMRMILPIVALIYAYILLGTVEVSFDMMFLMWMALIFMLANERPQPVRSNAA